jgi:16S rRNA (guanine527-N7)-methyltransferase
MSPESQLSQGLIGLGLVLSTDVQGGLLRYLGLLIKWNRTYNLTAIRSRPLVSHQFLIAAVLSHLQGRSVVDVWQRAAC